MLIIVGTFEFNIESSSILYILMQQTTHILTCKLTGLDVSVGGHKRLLGSLSSLNAGLRKFHHFALLGTVISLVRYENTFGFFCGKILDSPLGCQPSRNDNPLFFFNFPEKPIKFGRGGG